MGRRRITHDRTGGITDEGQKYRGAFSSQMRWTAIAGHALSCPATGPPLVGAHIRQLVSRRHRGAATPFDRADNRPRAAAPAHVRQRGQSVGSRPVWITGLDSPMLHDRPSSPRYILHSLQLSHLAQRRPRFSLTPAHRASLRPAE